MTENTDKHEDDIHVIDQIDFTSRCFTFSAKGEAVAEVGISDFMSLIKHRVFGIVSVDERHTEIESKLRKMIDALIDCRSNDERARDLALQNDATKIANDFLSGIR